MSNALPFSLTDPYSEIPREDPGKFWSMFKSLGDKPPLVSVVKDLRYLPDELKGGEGPEKAYGMEDTIFSRVSFSYTTISNFNFKNCHFFDCIFVRATFDELEFHDCTFTNCNFGKCRIKDTYIDPSSFSKCLDKDRDANIGIHLFQQLMRNYKDMDQPDFYRGAEFMFRRFRRSETWYKLKKSKISKLRGYPSIFVNVFIQIFFGYGVRISHFVGSTLGLFLIFWLCNYAFWEEFGLRTLCDTCTVKGWDKSLYYTAVSLSNLGYGDIVPSGRPGMLWASLQAIVGAIWFAIMASMIFKRISSR